ncbi:uncharacterized protein LOC119796512 isoform X2 [Cyprinodon tularosa]|uniref:uncharacterized protein LOC119796512 isoform X2 n=1 Tax=Cyprinodon tularosa TaxID=77115 RepID=UPI0018E1FFF4|nr:uncharacterized protein LOC119796512 isoform X2 [Cyprinodon tularosa]
MSSDGASNEGNACEAPGTDQHNQEETKADESSSENKAKENNTSQSTAGTSSELSPAKGVNNLSSKCPDCSRNIVSITKVDQDTFNIQIQLKVSQVSSEANPNPDNVAIKPCLRCSSLNASITGIGQDIFYFQISRKPENEEVSSEENSSLDKVTAEQCPHCFKITASITGIGEEVLNCQISLKSEKVMSTKTKPNPDGEAMHLPIKCPYCSREIVSLMEINLDTFNLQISLKPESENVPFKENPTPGQEPEKDVSWYNTFTWGLYKVKVYCFCRGGTFGTDETIMKKLKESKKHGLWSETVIEETKSLEDSSVNIVFCPIISRVGSDVKSAMGDPRVSASNKPVILVLMHHTRDADYSTGGKGWIEDYKNVKLDVVHVLFHETVPGLLECKQNEEAINSILQKLYSL